MENQDLTPEVDAESPVDAPAEALSGLEAEEAERNLGGRPPYVPRKEDHENVRLWRAMGIPINSIWKMLGIGQHVFDKHFRVDLHMGRDVIKTRTYAYLMASAKKGNITAIRELNRLMEKADIADAAAKFLDDPVKAEETKAPEKLGKKEAAQIAAKNPDVSTPIGELMAKRAKLRVVA
jgi:hypothetical protein